MNLTIPFSYYEDRSQVVEVITLAEVTKVQKSNDGFKTSTGTTRTCDRCRRIDSATSGVGSWPVATWLLTAEVFGDRREIRWALCSLHFKWLRDEERNTRDKGDGFWSYGGTLEDGTFEGTYRVTTPEWEGPWLDTDEMWGIDNDADWEPVPESE